MPHPAPLSPTRMAKATKFWTKSSQWPKQRNVDRKSGVSPKYGGVGYLRDRGRSRNTIASGEDPSVCEGSMDPYSRAPRSPKSKQQTPKVFFDTGLSSGPQIEDCKSPSLEQVGLSVTFRLFLDCVWSSVCRTWCRTLQRSVLCYRWMIASKTATNSFTCF